VLQEPLVLLVSKDQLAMQAQQVPLAQMEPQVQLDQLVLLALRVLQVQPVQVVVMVAMAQQVQQAFKAQPVLLVQLAWEQLV
jgi:hypothetical protein